MGQAGHYLGNRASGGIVPQSGEYHYGIQVPDRLRHCGHHDAHHGALFPDTPDCDLTERIAEGLLIAVRDAGRRAIENPADYEARATLMWASSLSHNDLTGCGKPRYFPVHKLEHPISALHDNVSHGAGLSVLFPAWAKYMLAKGQDVMKFAQLANRVWGVEMNFDHPERTAAAGIDTMKRYFAEIGMPTHMSEFLGLTPDEYEPLSI